MGWRVPRRRGLSNRAKRYGLVAGYAAPPQPQRPQPAPERHLHVDHPGEQASWCSWTVPRLPAADEWLCGAGAADDPGRVLEASPCSVPDPQAAGLRLDLERYLRFYNTQRAHTGRWTKGRTPEAVLGKAKLWHHKG
jgi:hypothetical protein